MKNLEKIVEKNIKLMNVSIKQKDKIDVFLETFINRKSNNCIVNNHKI